MQTFPLQTAEKWVRGMWDAIPQNPVEESASVFQQGAMAPEHRQVRKPKSEDWGLIEILKWCMASDCLFRANR